MGLKMISNNSTPPFLFTLSFERKMIHHIFQGIQYSLMNIYKCTTSLLFKVQVFFPSIISQ